VEAAGVGEGVTVLVHGAAGGVGGLVVQLARRRGARVIATASVRNHDYLRSLGAEPVTYGEGLPCLHFVGENSLYWLSCAEHIRDDGIVVVGVKPADVADLTA